jgi:rubrerythrin
VLKHLEKLRIRLIVSVLWSSRARTAEAIRGFQATEADGVWHLHRGLQRITDPRQRAIVFTHSLEEESHAEEFARVYGLYSERPMTPATYERDDLHGGATALWKSFAYVHVGEEDATERFRHLRDALGEGALKEALARIVQDESTHVDLTHDMLLAMGASDREIRAEVLRVRASRLWAAWLRSGKRVVDVVASALLSAAYLVLGLFLGEPARRRLASRLVEYDNNQLKRLG